MVELDREYLVKKYGKDSLINLTRIDIIYNQIRTIDYNTFKGLAKLEELSLGDSEIEEIDLRLFETLSNLKKLDLSNNKLKRIDCNNCKGLDNLEELLLNYKEIEEIDLRLFESLSNLKELRLSNNKLKRIDSNTFKTLTKLETLYLDNNPIVEIDVRLFESLSNLKELQLGFTKLKKIDSITFKGLAKLEKLALNNNAIEEIDVRSFESLSNLKYLYLNSNKPKRIDSNTFKGLTKLEKLYLYSNELEEIDVRLFESLTNLKQLKLHKNKLNEIDRKCFEPLKSIEGIVIYENVGLNALSFIKPSTDKDWYDTSKVKKYGSISEWDKFLQQFPQLEKQRQQETKEREEGERQQREAFDRLKIEEENKRRAKEEQSSSSSNLSATNKDIDKEIKDPYIGLFLNDRYEIKTNIGKGSSGLVYLVDDTRIDIKRVREKAMKIMDKLDSVTENELDLFSRINHENIVKYLDHFHMRIGIQHKTLLITEYCQKGDLRKKIEKAKRYNRDFDERQILDWISQATNALKYLHSRKPDPIIHRDIKPENMLLSGRDEMKLTDLGTSKLMDKTHASTHAGTPVYMSPEMFKAIYSFPKGQRRDPPIPTEISSSGLFSSILPKMLDKDCLKRITSDRLFTELLNL